ncbi:MAG: hypothetical protein HY913_01170 [Desulfomonile tiedjei]|nr:hypothetical protein [Desulfomonile tiedjei]
MRHNRVWLLAVVLSLSIGMFAAPASAWEFTMTGAWTWEYDIRSQGGKNGFFGRYDVSQPAIANATAPIAVAAGTFAPYNAWLGIQAFDLVSGSDAAWQTQYMINNMELRINPAVRVRGSYWIGEWNPFGTAAPFFGATDRGLGDLVASEYLNNRFPGVQRSFSPGYWNTLWMTAQTPWGILTLGKRPNIFGTGLFYNGIEHRTSESFSMSVPYGPLTMVLGFHPARRSAGTGFFNTDFDKNNGRIVDASATAVYRSGPVDIGIRYNYGSDQHRGGESVIAAPGATQGGVTSRNATRYRQDFLDQFGSLYIKYNNGRFFFNAEGAFDYITARFRQGNDAGVPQVRTLAALQTGTAGLGSAPQTRDEYVEALRFVMESGVLCGPAKVAGLYAWLSGPDRRNGIQIDRTGLITTPATSTDTTTVYRAAATNFSNTGLFRPYSYLMVYTYGLGAFINADTGNGYADDASIFAARVDYAVAANLNFYTSFMWADRASKSGWGWGFIRPNVDIGGTLAGAQASNSAVVLNLNSRSSAPNIPDTNLGWEIDWGVDWKLLEGLLLNTTFAYWKPGRWWNYACVDKSAQVNWNVGRASNFWGINPNRTIDGIFALELKFTAEF